MTAKTSFTFTDRAFIDHHNLRRLDYLSEGGLDGAKLEEEVQEVKRNLDQAARCGVTSYVVFSRTFDELVNYDFDVGEEGNVGLKLFPEDHPRRRAVKTFGMALTDVAGYAHSLGLRLIFHNNQFRFPDEVYARYGDRIGGTARVCPGREFTWELFRGKIADFFRNYPDVDGLQMTTSETQVSPLECGCADCKSMSAGDRLSKMVAECCAVCRPLGKQVQIRTWGIRTDEDYIRMLSRLPKDVLVSTKHTQGDFHLNEPLSTLVGVGASQQVVEFDLWGEYKGWNYFPCYMGDLLAERLRMCRDKGVRRVAARLNWNPFVNYIFERPWGNEVNVFLYSQLTQNPDRDPDDLLREWIGLRYPPKAQQPAFDLYKLSPRLQEVFLTFRGHETNDHSRSFVHMGRPNLMKRLDGQVGGLARGGYRVPISHLRQRRESLNKALEEAEAAVEKLGPSIPPLWREQLRNGAQNQWYAAQAVTDCLMMWSSIRFPDPSDKLDLDELERAMRIRSGAWSDYDPSAYDQLQGESPLVMLKEIREGKVD